MLEKLKVVTVTIVTSIIIVYAFFFYLEPDEARNLIPLMSDRIYSASIDDLKIENIDFDKIKNRITQKSTKNTTFEVSDWKTYTNASLGLDFKYPKVAISLIESNKNPFDIRITLPKTLATKVSREIFVDIYDASQCKIPLEDLGKSGRYIPKTYNNRLYAFRSEQLSSQYSTNHSFVAYGKGVDHCYVFDMRIMKENEKGADYNITTDLGDIAEYLFTFEQIMNTVNITK